MRFRVPAWWTISVIDDPLDRHSASLVQALLIGMATFALAGTVATALSGDALLPVGTPLAVNLAIMLLAFSALAILRRGRFRAAVLGASIGLVLTFAIALFGTGIQRAGTLPIAFALPITLTGLLLERRALWAMVLGCTGILMAIAALEQQGSALVGFSPAPPLFVSVSAFGFCVVLVGLFIDQFGSATRRAVADVQHTNTHLQHELQARERLEAQLVQSQKLESVGRLAGGIAHDFNNLLTVIMAYGQLAQRALPADAPLQPDLAEIVDAAGRASALTGQILAYARQQVIEPHTINLNDLLSKLEQLLRRLIGEQIVLVTIPAPDLGSVTVDPGQIEQVLLNLAVNARDAMPNGGQLVLETANSTLDSSYAAEHLDVIPGDYCMVAVSDTGQGMEASVAAQAFEPFFTTKARGRGTGLGLATCYGIIKQHHGHIWIYSEPGQGTTIKVYLPRVNAAAEDLAAPQPGAPVARGWETVLLVEDDPAVRGVAVRTLREYGYQMLAADTGAAALALLEQDAGLRVALLITDVVLPDMNGRVLAAQATARAPALRVLYISGYTENVIVHAGRLDPAISFLPKPFTPDALARTVRSVLDQAS